MTAGNSPYKLIVTDIDNTVFNWVDYYVTAFNAMLDVVAECIGSTRLILAGEAKEVFSIHGSIEYPFVTQEMPSVNKFYGADIDGMLLGAVRKGRDAFNQAAEPVMRPYFDVVESLEKIRKSYPALPIVALTDAPRYVAMWKLNKLGILHYYDAVYGLADPRVPICSTTNRIKLDNEILLKHLQQINFGFKGKIRVLPDDYEKPGIRGLKTVLMDYDVDEPHDRRETVLWIGDNLRKDVGLGNRLKIRSAWAEYGADLAPSLLTSLALFSPAQNIHKNVYLKSNDSNAPKPDVVFQSFADILTELNIVK
jgi:FMN phosphatase YigB (HAD superfamily)